MDKIDQLAAAATAAFLGTSSMAPAMAWGFSGHLGKAASVGAFSVLLLLGASFGWRKHRPAQGNLLRLFVR